MARSTVAVPGFGKLSDFFPTKEEMFGTLFSALGSTTSSGFSQDYNYTTKIKAVRIMLCRGCASPDAVSDCQPCIGDIRILAFGFASFFFVFAQNNVDCYSGPKELPKTSLCCDPMNVPGQCIGSAINYTANPEFKPFVNQTTLSPICKNQPPISAIPPSSSPDTGTHSPAPTTPTPSSSSPGPKSAGRAVERSVLPVLLALLFCAL